MTHDEAGIPLRLPVLALSLASSAALLGLSGCIQSAPEPNDAPTAAVSPSPAPDWAALDMGFFVLQAGNETSATWKWTGELPPRQPIVGAPPPFERSRVTIPGGIPWILEAIAAATSDISEANPLMSPPNVRLDLQDTSARPRCGYDNHCLAYVLVDADEGWTLDAVAQDTDPPTNPFSIDLRLTRNKPWTPTVVGFHPGGTPATPLTGVVPHVRPSGFDTGEPTIGVTRSGFVFTNADGSAARGESNENHGVFRSRDEGRTWDYVQIASVGFDGDPWVWVDPSTSRVFRLALILPCSTLATSDDDGATWRFHPVAGCGLPSGHYEKLTTGPPPAGVITQGYPSVVYYSSSLWGDYLSGGDVLGHTSGVWIATSLDGGETWQPGTLVHPGRRGCYGWGGPVVVAADGTAYSPAQYCDGVRVALSRDGGATWVEDAMLTDAGMMEGFQGPRMSIDRDGRLFLVHGASNGHVMLWWRDPGGAWSKPLDITPPGVLMAVFSVVQTGTPGHIAAAFFGTTSDPNAWPRVNSFHAPDDTAWHLHVVLSEDVLGLSPTFTAHQLTPPDDPIQRGCIDMQGSQITTCRNLLDFMDMTNFDGRALLAFPDGCLRCSDAATSKETKLGIVLIEGFDLGDCGQCLAGPRAQASPLVLGG